MKSLFAFLFLIPLAGISQSVDQSHELLWEITGNGIQPSYLFGTMHTNDRRVYNLSDSTYIALDRADMISCEVDIFSAFEDRNPLNEEIELKYDRNGEPYTSSPFSSETAYGNEDGMPQPLDAYFQQYCYNAGKVFEPLETIESQLNMFDDIDLSPDWGQIGLSTLLRDEEEILQMYIAGDIYGIDQTVRKSLNVFPDMYDAMIVDRNHGMTDKLDSLMQNQSVFCAIGAGHLAGSSGVINLLKSKGYSVRKVQASYSDEVLVSEKNVKSFRDYTYENDSIGFRVIFPGKPTLVNNFFDDSEELIHLVYRDLGQGNSYEVEVYERTDDTGLEALAEIHIPTPQESSIENITLENGGEAYQGIAQTYWDGTYWIRVVATEEIFIVIKAYGGNKFMNSPRPFRFFDQVWID